jgi:hypothetical protein
VVTVESTSALQQPEIERTPEEVTFRRLAGKFAGFVSATTKMPEKRLPLRSFFGYFECAFSVPSFYRSVTVIIFRRSSYSPSG